MTPSPSKTDMARAIVQRLRCLPALPAADSPLVADILRHSDAMVRILYDGADPAEPAHGFAPQPRPAAYRFPAPLAAVPKQRRTASQNAAACPGEMVLRLDEAEGDLLRDAIELISTRPYAADRASTIDSLLAKLRIQEMIQAGRRIAEVREDLRHPGAKPPGRAQPAPQPLQARPADRWGRR